MKEFVYPLDVGRAPVVSDVRFVVGFVGFEVGVFVVGLDVGNFVVGFNVGE